MSKTILVTDEKSDVKSDEPKAKKIDFGGIKKDEVSKLKKPSIGTETIDDYLSEYKGAAKVVEPEQSATENNVSETQKIKPKIRRKKGAEPTTLSGDILTGAMFISIIDLALPLIIVTVNNTIDKKHKITIDKLKLKASQKKELEPHAEAVMKELELKANPMFIFITALISIYGLNFVNVKYGLD